MPICRPSLLRQDRSMVFGCFEEEIKNSIIGMYVPFYILEHKLQKF